MEWVARPLGLPGGVDIHYIGYLGQTFDDPCDLSAEFPFDIFEGDIGVLYRVVEQSADGTPDPKTDLFRADPGDGQGVKNIGLTTLPAHRFVSFGSHFKGDAQQFLVPRLEFGL